MTAMGEAVNFGSRIESVNKEYGTELLISEDVYHQVAEKVCHYEVNRKRCHQRVGAERMCLCGAGFE